jgi:sugar phosphate isomerase/epimerase
MQNRRQFIQGALAGLAVVAPALGKAEGTIGLGLGNYGFKSYKTVDAIKFISGANYDSVELTLIPGWPTEPANVSPAERAAIRAALAEHGMALPSLLEAIPILGDHQESLERIKRGIQFGHDVNAKIGGIGPCLQTHIGGATKDWESKKALVADRLHDWAEVGRSMKMPVSIKGHNLNLNDTSEKTLWLMKTVNSPWLRVIYDYSHYQAGGENMDQSMDLLIPYTNVISIKDGKNYTDKPGYERMLPGDGTIDYAAYYRHLMRAHWSGHTVVEISAQLQSRPDYDPVYAAKHSYEKVAPVMAKVGVKRPKHKA